MCGTTAFPWWLAIDCSVCMEMHKLRKVCADLDEYLRADERNVAAIHCKAQCILSL